MKTIEQKLMSGKPKLALGGKAVHAGMGTIYKYAGAQLAMVSHGLPLIVKVRNSDHLFTISLCSELMHRFLHF